MKLFKSFVYVLLSLSFILNDLVYAGTFAVNPVRVSLSSENKTDSINIKNHQNIPVLVQVEVFEWTQNDKGEDIYLPTEDIVVSPPILNIEPNEEYTVRLGLNVNQVFNKEKAYRLFFQEVLDANSQVAGLSMALRIGIPIFVLPKDKVESNIQWKIEQNADKTLWLSANNVGLSHIQILTLDIFTNEKKVFSSPRVLSYLLPAAQKKWLINYADDIKGQRLIIKAKTDEQQNPMIEAEMIVE